MHTFKSGDKIIVSKHLRVLGGAVGLLYKRCFESYPPEENEEWWVFIPDNLRTGLVHLNDPILSVCWVLWENDILPYEGRDV